MSAWMSGDVGRMTGIVLGHLVVEICLCPRATQRSKRVSGQPEQSLLYGWHDLGHSYMPTGPQA